MKSLQFRPLFLLIASYYFWMQLQLAQGSLEERWKIDGPRGRKKYPPSADVNNNHNGVCDTCNSPLAFQLEYTIHKDSRYVKYRIFEKDCENEFQRGKAPIKGSTGDAANDDSDGPFSWMTLSAINGSSNDQIASVEITPVSSSSLSLSSVISYMWNRQQPQPQQPDFVEFCIRMGLFLPPEAGESEVNFRETNVKVTYKDDQNIGRRVDNISLDPRPMHGVTIQLFGGGVQSSDTPIRKGDESSSKEEKKEEEEVVVMKDEVKKTNDGEKDEL